MSDSVSQTSMKDKVAQSLADMMQGELDLFCPEESMSRFLRFGNKYGQILNVRYEEGVFIVSVDVSGVTHELRMKPVEWIRVTPARKLRNDD